MGCGKSKYDVASGNTLLHRKKSSVNSKASQEDGTQTVHKCNGVVNVDNASSDVKHEKNNENVKEIEVLNGNGEDESNDVKDKALEKSQEVDAVENKTQEIVVTENSEPGKIDDLLEKNENEVIEHDASATTEEKKEEKEKEDVSLKEETLIKEEETKNANNQAEETKATTQEEETKDTNQEKAFAKEEETKDTTQEKALTKEEETKDANVSIPKGEQKDLKVELGTKISTIPIPFVVDNIVH
ncbi:hypothetical protein VNO77_05774 [Canavalia gladiata]|uniref:Uncharacterized protein n=1 Tax=Canavalia gladiata TaxID=3824 RepID=A0AAN9MYY7_CANGL